MLSEKIIQKLKQKNISVDGDKTKQRVEMLWKAASRTQQEQVLFLSGVKRTTVYRIYKTGSISAKLAVPLAQILDVDPLYLMGQTDERGECQGEQLLELLANLGYGALIKEHKKEEKKRQSDNSKKTIEEEDSAAPQEPEPQPVEACCCAVGQQILDELSEEDLVVLLKGVLLRAKVGGRHAQLADQIKTLLIS